MSVTASLFVAACAGRPDKNQTPLAPVSHAFPLTVLWSFEAGGTIGVPPRLADGVVLIQSGSATSLASTHYAIDAATGELLWKHTANSSLGYSKTTWGVVGQNVVLANSDTVVALDVKKGSVAWTSSGYNAITSVATSGTDVFVSSKNWLTDIDGATGSIRWRNTSMPGYSYRVLYDGGNNRLIVPAERYYVLDPRDGSVITATGANVDCVDDLRYYEGLLLCETITYDATTGDVIVSTDFGANDYAWFPPIDSNILFVRTDRGTVKAVGLPSMTSEWEYQPGANTQSSEPQIISNVALMRQTGFAIADDATLRAFSVIDGSEVGWWQYSYVADWRTGTWIYVVIPGLFADGERLYATFGDQYLYAFGIK
jgi:outer membrane protein assembly factor BamB